MTSQARASVNVRIYQLERKLEQLKYDAERASTYEEAQRILKQAHEIELLIGY